MCLSFFVLDFFGSNCGKTLYNMKKCAMTPYIRSQKIELNRRFFFLIQTMTTIQIAGVRVDR